MDLSIVIINWNSAKFLRKCLASIYSNTKDITFEVLVVDNASYDGAADLVRGEFPSVCFIQSTENIGFARGNNLASERATGNLLLFLNSDTEIVGPAIRNLVAWIENLPDAGILGPRLLNSDLSTQTSCVQPFPSILNQALGTAYLNAMFPKWPLWGNHVLYENSQEPRSVEGISGACLMIRRSVFQDLGRFNPGYFMYAEDMDLCYKAKKAGKTNYYLGTATVIHHGGQSTNSNSDRQFSAVMMRESLLRFMRIHRGTLYAWLFRSTTALAAVCRLSLVTAAMLLPVSVGRRRSLSVALSKWARVFRWAIGLESWVKQST